MHTTQREIRCLTTDELIRLRRHAEARAIQAQERGSVGAVRAWVLLDTLLSSGLRASEVAALRVADCLLGYGQAALLVRQGKGSKRREVFHPPRTENASEGLPDLEASPWRGCLRRSVRVHRLAGAAHPERCLAGGQGSYAGRGPGSAVRHAHARHTHVTHLYRVSGVDIEVVQDSLAMPVSRPRRSTQRSPRRIRAGLRTLWRRPTETRNGTAQLVRVGPSGDRQVQRHRREMCGFLNRFPLAPKTRASQFTGEFTGRVWR